MKNGEVWPMLRIKSRMGSWSYSKKFPILSIQFQWMSKKPCYNGIVKVEPHDEPQWHCLLVLLFAVIWRQIMGKTIISQWPSGYDNQLKEIKTMPETNNSRMKIGAVRSLLFCTDPDEIWMFIDISQKRRHQKTQGDTNRRKGTSRDKDFVL